MINIYSVGSVSYTEQGRKVIHRQVGDVSEGQSFIFGCTADSLGVKSLKVTFKNE